MTESAFNKIFRPNELLTVWDRMYSAIPTNRRNNLDPANVSANDINEAKELYARSISDRVNSGSYRPADLVAKFVPKANGKLRVICVPTYEDRWIQRAVLGYLNSKGYSLQNEVSFGFIKNMSDPIGKAGKKAVELRSENEWAYKTDIAAFFDNVGRDVLKDLVSRKVRVRSLRDIICQFIDTEAQASSSRKSAGLKKYGIRRGKGLRQGMPISPYLANLYLADFDRAAIRRGLRLVRYADDLLFLGKSEKECQEAYGFCKNRLEPLGLTVPELGDSDKTCIVGPRQPVEFLGVGMEYSSASGYQLVVTDRQIESVKSKIFRYKDLSYCERKEVTLGGLLNRLDATIAGYTAAYEHCVNLESFRDKLISYKSCLLAKLFYENFKIDIKNLSDKERRFLELV